MDKEFYAKHRCDFIEDTHTYYLVDTETDKIVKKLLSVTQLLKKHGLAPNYSAVKGDVLSKASEHGTNVHAEIENYIISGKEGITQEFMDFLSICKEQDFIPTVSEVTVFNDCIAGKIDLLVSKNDQKGLVDIKTNKVFPKSYTTWQTSLYNYLLREMGSGRDFIGGISLNEKSKYVPLKEVPQEDIENLLMAEREGEIYQSKSISIPDKTKSAIIALNAYITSIKTEMDKAVKEYDELKDRLKRQMEGAGVKSVENDYFKITYIEPSEHKTIDSKRLKKEMPDLYEQYARVTTTEASVRITMRDGQ